ncbi:hypothetical protein Pcinc_019764 [Petrolisthes cinctipes]|uniref:Uncharacterized protein n=1 Tax=Petrolisthes cinctipes TaxID=88211 RepID=A0AAE1FJI5_PETCI|nr:hypothetical protein Pcinc_019764 [Petrolisthes cinctipes]
MELSFEPDTDFKCNPRCGFQWRIFFYEKSRGLDGVSYVFKWESSAQLPQSPFPQVTTEEVSKAAAELALLSHLLTPTLHQDSAAPRSNHLLSLPSVEDRGAEALVKPLLSWWNKKATSKLNSSRPSAPGDLVSVISNSEDLWGQLGKFLSAPLSDTAGVPALPSPSTELVKEDDLASNRALSQFSGMSLLFWLAKTPSAQGTASSAAFDSSAAFRHLSTLAMASIQALHPSLLSMTSEALSTRLRCRESMLGGIDMAVRQSLFTSDPLSPAALDVDRTKELLQTGPQRVTVNVLHRNSAPSSRAHQQSSGPSRGSSHSRSFRHLPYPSTLRPSASVHRQETGRRQDSSHHHQQSFHSDSRDLSSLDSSQAQGLWTPTQSGFHINAKELIVALIFRQRFPKLQKTPILFPMDNQIAVQCIRCQGSSHSLLLLSITEELFDLAAARHLHLTASYLPSRDNVWADDLSHQRVLSVEWELRDEAFLDLVDLFSCSLHHHQRCC